MASAKYLETLTNFCKAAAKAKNFTKCAKGIRPISATEGHVRVEFEITEDLTNPARSMHGGCTATMVDIVTTAACVATPRAEPGVSVSLHVNYLAPAKLGETVIVDGRVTRLGRSLAYTEAELYRKKDNVLIAKGLHTKAFPPKEKK